MSRLGFLTPVKDRKKRLVEERAKRYRINWEEGELPATLIDPYDQEERIDET